MFANRGMWGKFIGNVVYAGNSKNLLGEQVFALMYILAEVFKYGIFKSE